MTNEVKVTGTSTVPNVLNDRINAQPDLIAIIEGETRLTYREFGERVHHTAAALQDLGIQKGEKVALIFENGVQFPVVLFAVYQIGAVPLSVNPTLKPEEIRHIMNDSETVAVIVGDNFQNLDPIGTIESIRSELPLLRYLIVDGTDPQSGILLSDLLENTPPRKVEVEIDPNDLAVLIYTSGTTGLPKGGMHTHRTQLVPIGRDSFQRPSFREMILIVKRYGFRYITRFIRSSVRIWSSSPLVPPTLPLVCSGLP
jgi:acyl-CoA synthetase (AMP-forming)/AMP-acid ligase II